MEIKEINGFVESLYKSIPIAENADIRVLTSECKQTQSMLVDIRKYSLYGNTFDGIKRPTKKGIKFRLHNTKDVVNALLMILISNGLLEQNMGEYIIDLIEENVEN